MGIPFGLTRRARALLGCDYVARRSHTTEGMLAPRALSRSKIPLASCYCYFLASPKIDEKLWDVLVDELLNYYKANFSKNDFEIIENAGAWVCVGMSEDPYREEKDEKKNIYRPLDRKDGFILNYGYRKPGHRDGSNLFHKGGEKRC